MHWYSRSGELQAEGYGLPSVTTILAVRHNPGLWAWRERVGITEAERKRQESAEIGSKVHAEIQATLDAMNEGTYPGMVPFWIDPKPELKAYLDGFSAWFQATKPTVWQPEMFLLSELHEYAGTADLICKIDGEDWILDWKTTNHISSDCPLQLAAYAQAYQEMTGVTCRRGVLQLTDEIKRGYRFKEYTDDNDFGVFMAHKTILDWMWEGKRPDGDTNILFAGRPVSHLAS